MRSPSVIVFVHFRVFRTRWICPRWRVMRSSKIARMPGYSWLDTQVFMYTLYSLLVRPLQVSLFSSNTEAHKLCSLLQLFDIFLSQVFSHRPGRQQFGKGSQRTKTQRSNRTSNSCPIPSEMLSQGFTEKCDTMTAVSFHVPNTHFIVLRMHSV